MRLACLGFVLLIAACGDDGGDDGPVNVTPDAVVAGEPFVDAAPAGALSTSCDGECAQVDMLASFSVERPFQRSFFGLTAPSRSSSGEWEIYFEVNAGDDEDCPTQDSPVPDFLLSVSGLTLPTETSTHQDGSATIVDFGGEILADAVFEEAASMSLTWVAADPCQGCTEGTEPNRDTRFLAYDLVVNFVGGTVEGHGYATHCESLDQL